MKKEGSLFSIKNLNLFSMPSSQHIHENMTGRKPIALNCVVYESTVQFIINLNLLPAPIWVIQNTLTTTE